MQEQISSGAQSGDAGGKSVQPHVQSRALKRIRLLSVAVIAYNEESCIDDILGDLVSQSFDHARVEVILVDGCSSDGTKGKMLFFARANKKNGRGFHRVLVLDNPKRIQAAACNVALRAYEGDAFMRIDAHARIPSDFIENVVGVLDEGFYACGGPRPTAVSDPTPWRNTLHVAEESAFGSSIADYRRAGARRFVSSIFHGAYRREVFERVGLYNEALVRTEDNDMSYRIREAGFEIVSDPSIRSVQYMRSSLFRMLKQKFGNGYWIGRTLYVQPRCVRPYHLVPFAFVCGVIAMLALGVLVSWAPFLACAVAYLLLCAGLSVRAATQTPAKERNVTMVALPLVFALIHLSYGVGTAVGIVRGKPAPFEVEAGC